MPAWALRPSRWARRLDITEGLEGHAWAEQEFGDAPLGDRRLSKRLVESARIQAQAPGRAFSGAAQGDWPRVKGYYRMIDQPEHSAVTTGGDPRAASTPHHRAHAGAADGVVHPGWHGSELSRAWPSVKGWV